MSWKVSDFATDLSTYIKLLEDNVVPIECDKLKLLETQINLNGHYDVDTKEIVINIHKKIAHTNPRGIDRIAIYFSHKCEIDPVKNISVNDPIKPNYQFFFQINGYRNDFSKLEKNYCWRLDQSIASSTPKFTHPYYHFQAGGRELEYKNTGDLILLAAPRLPHPPMDLFLGLHFIFSNYLSPKDYPTLVKLYDDFDYQQIIKRAQKRMWEPYFNCFNPANTNTDYTFQSVFPLYLH